MAWRSSTKIVAAAALAAAGCATADPDLAAARDSWQGARYDDVVRAWGAPARSSKQDGRESHTWMSEDGGVIRGRGGVGGAGGIVFGEPGDPAHCDRTLVFSRGQVVEQKWLGPAAYCSRFKASRP